MVGNGAEIPSILRGNFIHRVHVVAVDAVVCILNLMLYHNSPLRLSLRQYRVGVELLKLLFVYRTVLLGKVFGMRFDDLACLFVDQRVSTPLLVDHHLTLLEVLHIVVNVTLGQNLVLEHRALPTHLGLSSILNHLLAVV